MYSSSFMVFFTMNRVDMHVINVIQCLNLGGMEQATLLKYEHLVKLGCTGAILSLNPDGGIKNMFTRLGIPVLDGKYSWLRVLRDLIKLKRDCPQSSEIIVSQVGHNIFVNLLLRLFFGSGVKLELHYHHVENSIFSYKWYFVYFFAFLAGNNFYFVSQFIRDEVCSRIPFIRDRSFIIGNPLRLRSLIYQPRQNFDEFVVGNAGWFIPRKRHDLLLDLALQLSERKNVKFLLAGDGPLLDAFKLQVIEMGLSDKFEFLGWTNDMECFYKRLHLLAFYSDYDALGRTPLEAATYGIPSICSVRNGGLKTQFGDNHGIYFDDSHNVRLHSQLIQFYLDNPDEYYNDSKRSYVRAQHIGDVSAYVNSSTFDR